MPRSLRSLEDLLGQVGDVPGDLLRPELGVPGMDLVLLDVDRGQHVVADQALREDDGVLVVVALPRHERHEQVLAQAQFARLGGGAVSKHVAPLATRPPLFHHDPLVQAGVLVRPAELGQAVNLAPERGSGPVGLARFVIDGDPARRTQSVTTPLPSAKKHVSGVPVARTLNTGADERGPPGGPGERPASACWRP